MLDKYISVELGDFKANISRQFNDIQKEVETLVTEKTFLQAGIDELTNVINNPPAGNVVLYPSMADPQEILIMDTKDINTARNIWRWNAGGLGHSKNGYAGPYEIGMTYDGMIVADRILTGTLKAIDIQGVTITGSAAYLDTLYSSFMPPLPLPQYREVLKIGGGSGFSLNAKRDNYPFPAMNIRLNTNGDLGFAIEALNETTGAVNADQVIRLSPYAGAEAPMFYSRGWCYVGANADGRVAFIDYTTWKSGGGPQIRYVPARASAWETASSATLKQDIEKLADSILYERFTAKDLVKDVEVFAYRLKQDAEQMKLEKNIGFIAELLPKVLRSDSDDIATVDLYKTSAWLWQYARENIEEVDDLRKELSSKNETLETALGMISDLQEENKALEQRFSDIEEFIKGRLLRR